jgi:hypothetical protein
MELNDVTFRGPSIDDIATFSRLPTSPRRLLQQINGFIQFGGCARLGCV